MKLGSNVRTIWILNQDLWFTVIGLPTKNETLQTTVLNSHCLCSYIFDSLQWYTNYFLCPIIKNAIKRLVCIISFFVGNPVSVLPRNVKGTEP